MKRILDKLDRYFHEWQFSVLDMKQGRWQVPAREGNILYLKAMNAKGYHILMKPDDAMEKRFMLCDDITGSLIEKDHRKNGTWKPGRLVVETSPESYQIWIHSSRDLDDEEKRYWLNKLGSDPGCSPRHRWGRAPGFRNTKPKHRTDSGYPLARLVWIDYRSECNVSRLPPIQGKASSFPSHACVCARSFPAIDIRRDDYQKQDESATDFAYALALLRRGLSPDGVYERILSERKDWQHHQGETRIRYYIERTIRTANNLITKR